MMQAIRFSSLGPAARYALVLFTALTLTQPCHSAAAQPLIGFPYTDEVLRYAISIPGGTVLGSGQLSARKADAGWKFELTLQANIPGFDLKDNYGARANTDLCSAEFTKQFVHGAKKGNEKETVDRSHATATRITVDGGGKSEFSVPDCTKDALTFLFYARQELGQGRVPPAQRVLFGGMYDVTLQYAGAQTIEVAQKPVITDEIVCTLEGVSSKAQFEIYFARDATRTPLLIKVPVANSNPQFGKFSMELVR